MSKDKLIPWRYYPQFSEIVDRHGSRIALAGKQENADIILEAVNNHDRLVEALKECLDIIGRMPSDTTKKGRLAQKTYDNNILLLTELKQQ